MNKVRAMIILVALPLTATEATATQGELQIVVNSAKNNHGQIQVALMKNAQQFNAADKPYAVCQQAIVELKAKCHFKALAHGEYAIFAFHDENKNHQLDENFLGAPKEKLAVSGVDLAQNPSPKFHQSKFLFNSQQAQVFINLQ